MLWLAICSLVSVPAAFLFGLLRSRLARGGLADLFRDLKTTRGVDLQDALAKTLGDPSLVVAYRLPGPWATPTPTGARARAPGRRRSLDAPRSSATASSSPPSSTTPRSTTTPSSSKPSAPPRAWRSRTSACMPRPRARLAEVQASRERIVAASDAERRRLERNLHDGAQQRLVALSLQLRLLEGRVGDDPSAQELVATASDELAQSLAELRELARGIHPAVLDHGLAAALDSLAARSPVPTTVDVRGATAPCPSRSSSRPTSWPPRR